MSIDMTKNFFRLLLHFRRQDLELFAEDHDNLYKAAKQTNDHSQVTAHYYSVMSTVIDEYFNGNFHFVPPAAEGLTLEEALRDVHRKIASCLNLEKGKSCVDIGCGIGGVIVDIEDCEANITGVTIAPNEVEIGNENFKELGIYPRCQLVEGDCHQMTFPDETQDAVYAVYALKYFVDLKPVLKEIHRILKPKGLFVVYDLIKTELYDENDEEHREIVEGLEYACGMPSLHSRAEMIEVASNTGLKLIDTIDIGKNTGLPFYYCFTSSQMFMWLVQSPFVSTLVKIGQYLRILPKGFHHFNDVFLAGTVDKIVRGGQKGILSGAEILLFEKQEN